MITDFLLEHSALVPGALAGIALICVGVGSLLVRDERGRGLLTALSALSGLVALVLTLAPSGRGASDRIGCTVQFALPSMTTVELLANVALFVPPVLFATLASRRPLTVLAIGSAVSAGIEVLQALLPVVGRACDTNDWFMNSIGVVGGVVLAVGMLAVVDRTTARRT
ncbi:VanZ family protein [Blastococcus haudaquaticus]|uniref:VanZ like family protein n=1 Tax=Blastococcus haudaquaticus TaxID=1938745 RepID=A0A286H454_9ACTN|nr:VanZ family protein [Blastococcus haudaquaticus]SOE02580.1 VanZ like family protein [Blastococcus haudaquaticus]